eukprot:Lankesteria_metandrocarpae@DN10316_c0_g1_i2.p1
MQCNMCGTMYAVRCMQSSYSTTHTCMSVIELPLHISQSPVLQRLCFTNIMCNNVTVFYTFFVYCIRGHNTRSTSGFSQHLWCGNCNVSTCVRCVFAYDITILHTMSLFYLSVLHTMSLFYLSVLH